MKRSLGLVLAFGLFLGLAANPAKGAAQAPAANGQAQSTDKTPPSYDMKPQAILDLQDMQKKFASLAEAFPAAKMAWRPGDGVRSVAEIFMHTAGANYGIPSMMGVKTPEGFNGKTFEKSTTDKTRLDFSGLINEVAALLQRELAGQFITLRLELAATVPPIFADRVQLQQVIINLIMNGVEAMQAIADRPRVLIIRTYEDNAGRVEVLVKDNGSGIPAENLGRLFDAFFSTKPGGLGIGLSICRSIIEEHGGRLWALNNRQGPGSTFEFSLPTSRSEEV